MFREALLESAPGLRRRNHWPMATAFTLELIAAGVLVLLPLISTGIIPLKASPPLLAPTEYKAPPSRVPSGSPSGSSRSPVFRQVVQVAHSGSVIDWNLRPETYTTDNTGPVGPVTFDRVGVPSGLFTNAQPVPVPPPAKPIIISHTTEAMLMNKVVPDYPQIARIAGIQGDVKLHAFVARDGTIRSLTVLGTPPPVLAKAALDAVQQWKYHPYLLNGEPVEIETFITVTFKKSN